MRLFKVVVGRDERLSIPRMVPQWEIAILQLIHGAEKVKVGPAVPARKHMEYPDVEAEYDRLHRRYGEDEDEKSFVGQVYGAPPIGTRELSRAIEAEREAEAAELENDPLA